MARVSKRATAPSPTCVQKIPRSSSKKQVAADSRTASRASRAQSAGASRCDSRATARRGRRVERPRPDERTRPTLHRVLKTVEREIRDTRLFRTSLHRVLRRTGSERPSSNDARDARGSLHKTQSPPSRSECVRDTSQTYARGDGGSLQNTPSIPDRTETDTEDALPPPSRRDWNWTSREREREREVGESESFPLLRSLLETFSHVVPTLDLSKRVTRVSLDESRERRFGLCRAFARATGTLCVGPIVGAPRTLFVLSESQQTLSRRPEESSLSRAYKGHRFGLWTVFPEMAKDSTIHTVRTRSSSRRRHPFSKPPTRDARLERESPRSIEPPHSPDSRKVEKGSPQVTPRVCVETASCGPSDAAAAPRSRRVAPTPQPTGAICVSFSVSRSFTVRFGLLPVPTMKRGPWLSRTRSIVQSPAPSHPFSNANTESSSEFSRAVAARATRRPAQADAICCTEPKKTLFIFFMKMKMKKRK